MAILLTPGQTVAGPDWEAVFAQHGGSKSNIVRPPTKAEMDAAPDEDFDQNPIYRYYAADGSYVEARKAPNGDYQIVDYKPSAAFTQAQPKPAAATDSPTAQRTAEENAQRARNRSLPPDQDPRDETDAQRAERGERVIKEQGAAARQAQIDADTKKRQAEQDARQARIDEQNAATNRATAERNASAEARAAAAANRIPNPDVPGGFLERGPDGTWRPIKTEGVETGAEPEGAPQPSGRLGEAAADLERYIQWINQERRKPGSKMTQAMADKLLEARVNFHKTALAEQTGVVNAQRSILSDQAAQRATTLSDLANRRTSATSIANANPSNLADLSTKLGAGPDAAAGLSGAIRNARVDAQNFVTMTGANRMVPEVVPGPALGDVNTLRLPGSTAASPQPAMPNLQVRPNAIGAGAIGNQPVPGTAPIVPAFRPPPPVTGSVADPQAAIRPSPYFLAGSSRGRVYDPTSAVQALIADPRMDNTLVRQVVAEQYPGYPIDDLLGVA